MRLSGVTLRRSAERQPGRYGRYVDSSTYGTYLYGLAWLGLTDHLGLDHSEQEFKCVFAKASMLQPSGGGLD